MTDHILKLTYRQAKAKVLIRQQLVPASICYQQESIDVQLEVKEAQKLRTDHVLLAQVEDDKVMQLRVKSIQRHPINMHILHIDFLLASK